MPRRFIRDGEVWKACPQCGVETPHNEEHYYRSGKNPDKTTKFYTRCKKCCELGAKKERTDRSPVARERKNRRMRARQRALNRLGQLYNREYQTFYEEELVKEYYEHGPMPPRSDGRP